MTERNYLYLNAHQHYIVYKTTNQINGKYYIGVHAQDKDPYQEDGYIGSGPVLQAAIKKYGKENFIRETLFVFDNYVDAYAKEAELVSPEFLQENKGKVYNLKPGGEGGYGMTEQHKQVLKDLFTGVPKTPEHRAKMGRSGEENSMFGLTGDKHPRFGTTHTDESKQKMSEKATIRMSDPDYVESIAAKNRGKVVVHKGDNESSVDPEELDAHLSDGWELGRAECYIKQITEARMSRMERERCEKFGVETNDELRELIVELYINQNMRIDDILLMYPKVSGMMFKTIRKKLNIPSKTREMWQSTAKR